jgi:malonyl-CoA decarboxylase
MVNYLYSIGEIEKNHEVFAESGQVVASAEVKRTLRADLASSDLVPARASSRT